MKTYYFDHAASSWPKPSSVIEAINASILESAANPGRGSHRMAVQASRVLFDARKSLAKLFAVRNPIDISFALNTTHALNQAIKGFVKERDHVICTHLEHNSVRRPLVYLRKTKAVDITYIPANEQGAIEPGDVEEAITSRTSLLIVNHSSNLLGSIVDLEPLGRICKEKGIKLLVDAAQTAGTLDIDVGALQIDMLAFPGHKGLLGPQGTGGLYIHPDLELEPLLHGGTGSQSEAVDQPAVRPDRYEAGTQNTAGIAGLNEGVKYVLGETVQSIHQREWKFTQKIMEEWLRHQEIEIYGPELGEKRTGIVSFNIKGADSSEVAFILDQSYGIAVRAGYHCTPLAHETAGTLEFGAVRASVGAFTTEDEVKHLIEAVVEISRHYKKNS